MHQRSRTHAQLSRIVARPRSVRHHSDSRHSLPAAAWHESALQTATASGTLPDSHACAIQVPARLSKRGGISKLKIAAP